MGPYLYLVYIPPRQPHSYLKIFLKTERWIKFLKIIWLKSHWSCWHAYGLLFFLFQNFSSLKVTTKSTKQTSPKYCVSKLTRSKFQIEFGWLWHMWANLVTNNYLNWVNILSCKISHSSCWHTSRKIFLLFQNFTSAKVVLNSTRQASSKGSASRLDQEDFGWNPNPKTIWTTLALVAQSGSLSLPQPNQTFIMQNQ